MRQCNETTGIYSYGCYVLFFMFLCIYIDEERYIEKEIKHYFDYRGKV